MTDASKPKPWEHAKSGAGSAADPLSSRFVSSLDVDKRLYPHDICGSVAHARMLANVGLISPDDLDAILGGLKQIENEIEEQGDAWPGWKVELEDVHMCIEAALIEKTGDPGRKLHTGRSRNDQVALDLKLWIEQAVDGVQGLHDELIGAFKHLAQRDGRMVTPSYTHLQRAQPIVVGGELIAWIEAFEHCKGRYAANAGDNPLGSGAVAGSALPLDRALTASMLNVGPVSRSSIEATASRDAAIDFTFALAMTSMWLSRFAEQWILYASTEFSFIALDPQHTTGSSMMPQKQNPDMLELIRGKTSQAYASLFALLTLCKGLTVGYNRDLQEDKRHVFAAYDSVCDCLAMAARIVAGAQFNEAKIKAGLDHGFLDATSLAEYLVTKGVAFRTAHQIVGSLVRLCRQTGKEKLSQLSVEQLNAACADAGQSTKPCGPDVFDWLGPENVVKRYQSAGNAGESGFEQQLKDWEKTSD